MNRVSDSPISKTDFELEISKQLDKIAETGNKFRDQILELGKKLKSFHKVESQKNQELEDQSTSTSVDFMKSVETKLLEVTNAQHKLSADIQVLEKRRLKLHEIMAGKLEDVLKDVFMLKSLTETTRELKPKLDGERKITRDLESQVEKMTRDLKGKLDFLDSALKSNQDVVKSSLEKFCFPMLQERIDSDGWILIQTRDSGPRDDFERGWTDYENGFGSINRNFWLGLKKIHELTADGSKELRVELTDWNGNFAYAEYSKFSVGNAADLYRLSISGYSGNAGDGLQWYDGSEFSTMDKETGQFEGTLKGGWWKQSDDVNLNGLYYEKNEAKAKERFDFTGIYWYNWKCNDYSLSKVLMKIRQRKQTNLGSYALCQSKQTFQLGTFFNEQ